MLKNFGTLLQAFDFLKKFFIPGHEPQVWGQKFIKKNQKFTEFSFHRNAYKLKCV